MHEALKASRYQVREMFERTAYLPPDQSVGPIHPKQFWTRHHLCGNVKCRSGVCTGPRWPCLSRVLALCGLRPPEERRLATFASSYLIGAVCGPSRADRVLRAHLLSPSFARCDTQCALQPSLASHFACTGR